MGVDIGLKGGLAPDEHATSTARDYYDSKDAQKFYSTVWGENSTHIGRYDLVEADARLSNLAAEEKIRKAQLLQEEKMMEMIHEHCAGDNTLRVLDMGCGYGGLIRTMAKRGMICSAVGVDISGGMIDAAVRINNQEAEEIRSVISFRRESFMNTSVPDSGVDLVISMDAFLHVGPGQHENVLKEAGRVLRPGGSLIFTDIVARDDAPPEASILCERLGLTAFATVGGYFEKAAKQGFDGFAFDDHSENVSQHYASVRIALEKLYADGKLDVSADFKQRMSNGLVNWRDLAPRCLQWGIISMRKVSKVDE